MSLVNPLLMMFHDMKIKQVVVLSTAAVGTTSTAHAGDIQNSVVIARNDMYRTSDLRRMLDTHTGIANDFVGFLTKEFSV